MKNSGAEVIRCCCLHAKVFFDDNDLSKNETKNQSRIILFNKILHEKDNISFLF